MNVVMISLDQALVNGSGEGDTLERFKRYAQACTSFSVIIPVTHPIKPCLQGKITIYPAYGHSVLTAYTAIYYTLKRVCEETAVDLVVTNDAVLGAIALPLRDRFRYKVQINVFGLEIINRQWLIERPQNIILKRIQEWALVRTDGIRTDNTRGKVELEKRYHINPNRIVVIPVTVSKQNYEAFYKTKCNKSLKKKLIGEKTKLVLSVGRLVKAKDFPLLITVARTIVSKQPQTIFVIAGDGPERLKLESLIVDAHLQSNVQLIGSVKHDELPALYGCSDLFVLSSAYEGLPRVLMYAALAGLAIVTTNIDGAQDIVRHGQTGYIVPIKGRTQLEDCVLELLTDHEKTRKFGRAGKEYAKATLDFENTAVQLIDSWKKLVYGK